MAARFGYASRQRGGAAGVVSVPAPVGGWNARDALDAMAPEDAVRLDNWFPGQGSVALRRGFVAHATGIGAGDVATLAEFHAGTTRRLLAAGGGGLYAATAPGAAMLLAGGFLEDRWQWANFNGALALVNGRDPPQRFDGTAVAPLPASGIGLDPSSLVGVNVFKSRSYFWAADSQDFWYSELDALGGTLTRFPLSRVSQFGGNLAAMATWTVDGGDGADDFAVFVMTSGDAVVYQGSDPAGDFALVGIYRIGAPLGPRGIVKSGGDLIVATRDGYVSLTSVLRDDRLTARALVSGKIRGAVIEAVRGFGDAPGWQAVAYPRGNRILFNVPQSHNGTVFHQHVVNTITGAWCRFTGMDARCWGLFDDRLHFGGGGGTVFLADERHADGAAAIDAAAVTAFSALGGRGVRKRVTAVRPSLSSDADIALKLGVAKDFEAAGPALAGLTLLQPGPAWDVGSWDLDPWAGGIGTVQPLLVRDAHGFRFAARLELAARNRRVEWYATDYVFEQGGIR